MVFWEVVKPQHIISLLQKISAELNKKGCCCSAHGMKGPTIETISGASKPSSFKSSIAFRTTGTLPSRHLIRITVCFRKRCSSLKFVEKAKKLILMW